MELEQQEQEKERQIQQVMKQARERELELQKQFQEKKMELDQLGHEKERQIQQVMETEKQARESLQQKLKKTKLQLEEREKEFQEKEDNSWVVSRGDIIMTEVVLGKGSWAEVKLALFCGLRVAAKCLHELIIAPYSIGVFSRQMNIASKIRHPNLLQFIGATTEGNPIILTELMSTSLRKEIETGGLAYQAKRNISLDVACALNYLHLFKPHPILHRGISSANVLLQPIEGVWRAKVSIGVTVSFQHLTSLSDPVGNPVYLAPEAAKQEEHSPAMDVFSYGVLLIEMVVSQFPEKEKRVAHIDAIKRPALKNLIERCLIEDYKQRPTMNDIIKEIHESISLVE